MRFFRFLAMLAALVFVHKASAASMELYIDASFSVNTVAAESIELGVRTALEEAGNQLGGIPVTLVRRDHRSNVKRSHRTMQDYLKSDRALAIIGGQISPPYLTHRGFINQNQILTLLPWSAAGPVTRAEEGRENWIFRLSVDDSKSGGFFVQQAAEVYGCKNIALLLLDTGWGRANHQTLTSSLRQIGQTPAVIKFFSSAIRAGGAAAIAREISLYDPDCAIMLSDSQNGADMTQALYEELPNLRLFSHWGIMGSDFAGSVSHQVRQQLQLLVLQTCWLRSERRGQEVLQQALASPARGAGSLAELSAPTGFVHGYDLAKLMIAAADQAAASPEWENSSIQDRRAMLRLALLDLGTPVEGILNTYERPFSPYSIARPDAHEALGLNDLCLARFAENGQIEDAG